MNYKEVKRGVLTDEATRYSQGIALVGNFVDPIKFTDQERRVLIGDGAVLYLPTGETIKGQREAGRPFWNITDGFIRAGKNRLTEFPSRRIEVAIYPDPERFFVPDTSKKTLDQQIALIEHDAQSLRERLGLSNIGEIIPEVPEVTEVLFRHFDATKVRILGPDYRRDRYWSYVRTSTPTTRLGSRVAFVGYLSVEVGLDVGSWDRGDMSFLHAARWVVPTGTR